ncbi:MAG: hypothetical protein GTN38_01200, partial [Candidatus Aenigmarchaeota archaeon]|nr:hypothetical protein [Candidatus Aenigmarchaeota archaeon]NIQ17744.1 hypothetical protein [Candidatus Aenigmarchaeota archaeon]NIS73064.1 hypothetical protein [Candidatus Aenigmarchaeota archaeon]
MNGGSPRELIIGVLKKHPEGLTITAISELTKLHRHTVTKYLYELRGADIIQERTIGPARLCYLRDGFTKKKEKETLKRLNNRNMKSEVGQIQILAVVLFLVLVPAAIITAQNATNLTQNVSIPLEGYIAAMNEVTDPNLTESLIEDVVSDVIGNETIIEPPNITINETESNVTFEINETNETVINETVWNESLENETYIEPPNVTVNETVNETLPVNVTVPVNETNVTLVPPEIRIVEMNYPDTVNVSEEFWIEIGVESLYNFSENITIELVTPESFENENRIQRIPYLGEGDSAYFEWNVKANECGNFTFMVLVDNNVNIDSRDFEISAICPTENITVEIETIQGEAIVGEPVKWKKIFKIKNNKNGKVKNYLLELGLPESAENVSVKNEKKKLYLNLGKLKKIFEIEEIPPNYEITYEVGYETPSPYKEEIDTPEGRLIIVKTDLDDVHYQNVNVNFSIPELSDSIEIQSRGDFQGGENPEFDILSGGSYKIFWLGGTENLFGEETDVTYDVSHGVEFTDSDNNGLNDTVKWNVPSLSEQRYLIKSEPRKLSNINVWVEDEWGYRVPAITELIETGNGYKVVIKNRGFTAGIYKLVFESDEGGEEMWFKWGLISINTKKSIYMPGETAEVLMVVLDKFGWLVSDAAVNLVVTSPEGTDTFSTEDGSITERSEGIYVAYYQTGVEGSYSMEATATAKDVESRISSYFMVLEDFDFDILRENPVVIDPNDGPFDSSIRILSYMNVTEFSFSEIIPNSLSVIETNGAKITETGDHKVLTWEGLENNSLVSYTLEAPKIWPYLYYLGPSIVNHSFGDFTEARPWLLAIDPGVYDCTIDGDSDYNCEDFSDEVTYGNQPITKQAYTNYANWSVGYACPSGPGPPECFLHNISMRQKMQMSFAQTWCEISEIRASDNTTGYDTMHVDDTGITAHGFGVYCGYRYPFDGSGTCIITGRSSSPLNNTCDLNASDGFNSTFYLLYTGANWGGPSGPIFDNIRIDYTWAWKSVSPKLQNETVSPDPGGWGETFNFTVNVSDPQTDNVSVYLWHSIYPGGPWESVGSQENVSGCNSSSPCNVTISYSGYTCDNITSTMYYFFNATDNASHTTNTSVDYFAIESDDVNIWNVTPSANAIVNRTIATNFTAQIYDKDNQSYDADVLGRIWISTYSYTQNTSFLETTNDTGHLIHTVTPGIWCEDETKYYLGVHYWKGEVYDSCLKENITGKVNFTLMGELTNTLAQPTGNQNFTQNDDITLQASVTDDCGGSRTADSTIILEMTNGVNEYNCTADATGACSINTNISYPTGWYNVSTVSNKSYYYNGSTYNESVFYLDAHRSLFNESVYPTSEYYTYKNWNFSVVAISGDSIPVNVTLLLKQPGGSTFNEYTSYSCANQTPIVCNNCINETFFWYCNFSDTDTGTWKYKFRMNNTQSGETEDETSEGTFDVNAPPAVSISLENVTQYPSSGSWGGGNFTFNVTVNTTGINNVTVYLWVGNDSAGPWELIGQDDYTIPPGGWQQLNFSKEFTCADIWNGEHDKYFFFNATNNNGTTNETSSQSFTVTKDNVIYEVIAGNNSIANRSSSQIDTLKLRLRDTDNNTYLPAGVNVTLWISYSGPPGYVYDDGHMLVTDADGNVTYGFDANCSTDPGPEYVVGEQRWYAKVNSSDMCYYANESSVQNLTVMGDFNLTILQPDGDTNYTWGDLVYHLARVRDDCANSIDYATSVFNISTDGYYENFTTTGIGSGLYQENWDSSGGKEGWYNVTFIVNKTYYYDNQTSILPPNTFYLSTVPVLKYANVTPRQEGWGRTFNFTVKVTDEVGDNVTTKLYVMKSGEAWNQIGNEINCTSCSNFTAYWEVNFTCGDVGTWFFKFEGTDQNGNYDDTSVADGEYVDDDNSFILEKNDIQITYVEGNESNAFYNSTNVSDSTSAEFILFINDTDRDQPAYSPAYSSPSIKFNVTKYGIGSQYYSAGDPDYNTTNSTGHVIYHFIPDCSYYQQKQNWRGYVDPSDTCYKDPPSGEYNVTVQTYGCEADLVVSSIDSAYEIFENKTFVVKATINAIQEATSDVNATIDVPPDWGVSPSRTLNLGIIDADSSKTANWTINITSYNSTTYFSVFANSSEGLNDTLDKSITVYKLLGKDNYQGQEKNLTGNEEMTFGFPCQAGYYRTGNLTLNWTGNTKARVYVYNSTGWTDILHSYEIISGKFFVPVFKNQTSTSEGGNCSFKIRNVGETNLTFRNASFEAYYKPSIEITDIIKRIDGDETNGMEQGDGFFNVSIKISNSMDTSFLSNITLNITNSSGVSVNSSIHTNVNIPAYTSVYENFTFINTTGWGEDDYIIKASLTYSSGSDSRDESFVVRNVTVFSYVTEYFCTSTTEELNLTIYHPFTDIIEYNVTFEKPSGWNVSPAYDLINISETGNVTISFNLTTDSTNGNFTLNVSVNYTYPNSLQKSRKGNFSIENSDDIAIFEVIRETPKSVNKNKVFSSSLVIHNKGCGKPKDNLVLKETVPTGWFPTTPTLTGGTDASPPEIDWDTNVITWYIDKETFGVNNYSIASYQVITPNAYSTLGYFRYNVSWGYQKLREKQQFEVTTMNYSSESHLEFGLVVHQRDEYPWPEPRSIQSNVTYNLSLKVTNRGDANTNNEWNASLFVSPDCNVTDYGSGSYNASNNEILWSVPDIDPRKSTYLNFTLNCSETGRKIFRARGIRDTRGSKGYLNNTYISSTGSSNTITTSYGFTHPGEPYEKLNKIHFLVNYDFTGTNLTIGEANVSIEGDLNDYKLVWQNYSFDSLSGEFWSNYTMDSGEKEEFAGSLSASPVYHNVRIYSHADSTLNPDTNVTVTKLNYTWEYGKLFGEEQDLFTKVKV